MGMTKLFYSSDFDPSVGVGAELITRQGELTKQASTIFGKEYAELKPDDRSVGIHVVALGDEEHYGCFFAGAPVSTIKGQKPIEDIVEGDEVLTHRGNYKKVLKTFTSLYSGTKVTVSVLGLPHDIECTEEHPFLVVRRDGLSPASRWKLRNAGELQNVLEARARSAEFVKASELEPGMFLVVPTRPSDEELSKYDDIPEELDPYVAGFYLAEGCLVKEYKAFAEWLDTVFGHDATEKHLHPQLYRWSDDQLLDFLAGYFDGDGCVMTSKDRYEGTLVCSTASRTLALDLQRMLASLGIPASVNQSWNKVSNGCFGHKDSPIYQLGIGSYRSNMILSRTRRLKPHARVLKMAGASSLQYARHYALLPISEVQFESVENVQKYNFEVEDDNSYVVDVAVHNCNRNADSFDKQACIKYHDTFVKHGHVFRHHRNKDPEKAIGVIKASAYNEPMGRIELFIHADKEKAAPELERLEKEGELPMSMACSVPFDQCFTKGTLVLTGRGFVPIESVSVGDICVTAEAESSRVVATTTNTALALTRVSVRGIPDEIECTPNHPFNVVSVDKMRSCSGYTNGLKRHHTPKDGTSRCKTCGKVINVSSEWKQACQLVSGDYIKERIDKCSVSVVRGVSFAYLCGMYVGDGSPVWEVSGHDNEGDAARITGLRISVSASDKDAGILGRIREAFRLCTGKDISVNREFGEKKAYIVTLPDRLLANKIVDLTGAYYREKFLSSEILTWSRPEKAAFVAGYLDADGAAGMHAKRPIFRICSVNKGLLLSVQRLLWSLGVPATVGLGNALEHMKNLDGFCHKSSSYHVFFTKAPSILVSASVKLSEFCKHNTFSNGGSGILLIDGYAYLPVSSVRTFESECVSTYNFEVEGDHTYIAEGVGVHNCSICGSMRKRAGDESECEHVRDHLGEMTDDGKKVFTRNTEPKFFDISFVGRPADRIAWNLKVASALPLSSVREAEFEGVVPPDDLACDTEAARRKLGYARDIAELQRQYRGWLSKSAAVVTARDGYLYELRRVPKSSLDDHTISRLREFPTKMAFAILADAGVIMDVPSFLKYATGDDYESVVKPYVADTIRRVPELIESRVKRGCASSLCTSTDFDAAGYRPPVKAELYAALKKVACVDSVRDLAIERSGEAYSGELVDIDGKKLLNTSVVEKLAEAYASYQLSAIDAVLTRQSGETRNKLDVEAVASSGNVTK